MTRRKPVVVEDEEFFDPVRGDKFDPEDELPWSTTPPHDRVETTVDAAVSDAPEKKRELWL